MAKGVGRPKADSGGCPAKRHKSVNTELASALGVVNIGGIFVVLLCGLAFAVVIAILGGYSIDFFRPKKSLQNEKPSRNV